jgi:hypothetical protein
MLMNPKKRRGHFGSMTRFTVQPPLKVVASLYSQNVSLGRGGSDTNETSTV